MAAAVHTYFLSDAASHLLNANNIFFFVCVHFSIACLHLTNTKTILTHTFTHSNSHITHLMLITHMMAGYVWIDGKDRTTTRSAEQTYCDAIILCKLRASKKTYSSENKTHIIEALYTDVFWTETENKCEVVGQRGNANYLIAFALHLAQFSKCATDDRPSNWTSGDHLPLDGWMCDRVENRTTFA